MFVGPGSLKELLDHDLKLPSGEMRKGSDHKRKSHMSRYLTKAKQIQIRNQVYFQNIMTGGQFTDGRMDNLSVEVKML